MIMTISGNQIEGIIVEGIASNDQIFCESFIETSLLVVSIPLYPWNDMDTWLLVSKLCNLVVLQTPNVPLLCVGSLLTNGRYRSA